MTDYSDSLQDQKPNPVCGARVDYHGGACGKPVGHDEPCAPVVEPERMPCGHSHAAIVSSGEGTSYCGECVEACSPDDYETGPEPKECPKCHVPWFGVCKACGIDMRKPVLDSTTYPKVRGKCPGCGGETLFLGSGGFVTCSLIGCDHPTSASELLHEWQVP